MRQIPEYGIQDFAQCLEALSDMINRKNCYPIMPPNTHMNRIQGSCCWNNFEVL